MPDTATKLKLERATGGRDRVDIRNAIAEVQRAEAQLAELERGQERARTKSWSAAGDVERAQETLAKLQAAERSRPASAWVEDDTVNASPIPTAEHALAKAREELQRINSVENALASELPKAANRLSDVKRAFFAELGTFVTESPEYARLCQAHRDCWTRLRTVRAALAVVNSACGGGLLLRCAARSWQARKPGGFGCVLGSLLWHSRTAGSEVIGWR